MSDYLAEFLERNKPVRYSSGEFKGDVAQVTLDFGFMAFVKGAPKFFPVRPPFTSEEKALNNCREHIAMSGQDTEPAPFVQITTYPPYLHNTKMNEWESPEQRMGMQLGYPGTEDDPTDYGAFAEQFLDEGSVMHGLTGKKAWAHFVRFPYPSYDERGANKYNSRIYTNQEGEEVTKPRFITKILRVFDSEQEAREWYAGQVNAVSVDVGGNDDMTRDEALARLDVPEGFDRDWGNWSKMDLATFREAMKDMASELVTKSAEEYHNELSEVMVGGTDHPITVEWLEKLREVVINHPEF